MLSVGLTGGIASGKSHVLRRLHAQGAHTIDLDAVAHEVMAPGGAAYEEVRAAFGPSILAPDRTIDRKALGAIVFGDPLARARLNRLVHPRVREEGARRARRHLGEAGAVVVTDAALLVESGVHLRFDRLVVAHCSEEQQLRRLIARDGLDEASARARLGAQMPGAEKRRFAHLEVDTSGTTGHTDAAVDALLGELRRLEAGRGPTAAVPGDRAARALAALPAQGPAGLTPRLVLAEVAGSGLELARLAARLGGAEAPPWFRLAEGLRPAAGPECGVLPLVLWARARGLDREFVAGAAFALGWLTHRDPAALADGCLAALVLFEAAGSSPTDEIVADLPALRALAAEWAGGPAALPAEELCDPARARPGAPGPAGLAAAVAALRGDRPAAGPDLDPELAGLLAALSA